MPLTPATTDLFQKVGLPGSATTLASPGYTIGNTGVTVGSTTNHPTDTLYTFAIDRAQTVNGVTSRIAGTYCEFEGIVASGTTIASMVLKYGTAQNYPAGSFTRVYIPVSSNRENQLIVGLRQDHNGKGNHQTLTDDNGNAWLARNQVASAVNYAQVANAIAGKNPSIVATGSDTNIWLNTDGKGSGGAVARNPELVFDHIVYGTGVWAGLGYGSTLTASMTAATCYINGRRIVIATLATRTFTASKDTYVDVLDNLDGTGTLVYTEVANNATSPALAANSVRMAIIVSGATNILNAGSVNQGQESMVLPIVSSVPYCVTDGLGNLICPRDPNRKVLGYKQMTANFSTASGSPVQMTGMSVPVIVPAGRKVKISCHWSYAYHSSTSYAEEGIWLGTVGSGTQIGWGGGNGGASTPGQHSHEVSALNTPGSGLFTFNISGSVGGTVTGTSTYEASSSRPAYVVVELV